MSVTKGLLVRLEALPGKEDEVQEFLGIGRGLVEEEPATVAWFAIRLGPSSFGIFDVFPDDAGRDAHLSGAVAAAPADGYASMASAAMDRMMAGMMVKPSGDVDRDFVTMMLPHHQGAIDMAVAELRYGHNEQLKRIAQEIIIDQQQEIAAMKLAIGQPLPPSTPAPTQGGDHHSPMEH